MKTSQLKDSVTVFNKKPKYCGFPEQQLNISQFTIEFKSKSRLCILNSYRKIMMAYLSVYKLQVQSHKTDDRFPIPEFIEKRIMQVPINIENYQDKDVENFVFYLDVKNHMQEPMIIYTDHIYMIDGDKRMSITQSLKMTDSYCLFKLDQGCYIQMQFGLIKQLPESDDKFRGCFISVFEDESEDKINNDLYISEREESLVRICTYGSMKKEDFKSFFCTQYIQKLLSADIVVRVDKNQSTIVFNNIPLFIVDALLCLHKEYFYSHFQTVMPTQTVDYQSCLILKPKNNITQQQTDIQKQLEIAINVFINHMKQLEQQISDLLDK